MIKSTPHIIFIFLDGFGIGRADQSNPMYTNGLFDWCGVAPVHGIDHRTSKLTIKGIDACLGVAGIPQSATGQTTLFTGVNAAQLLGYHLPAYPNAPLQAVIQESNIFIESVKRGKRVTFANAYRPEYFELVAAGHLKHAATTLVCLAAGSELRGMKQYNQHEALFFDITSKKMQERTAAIMEERTPEEAGAVLCSLAQRYDLVLFESFVPDMIGHARDAEGAREFCHVLSRFLRSVVRGMNANTTLLLSSDHGNFEDLSGGGHTSNPAVLFAYGPAAPVFATATSIADIAPTLLSLFSD